MSADFPWFVGPMAEQVAIAADLVAGKARHPKAWEVQAAGSFDRAGRGETAMRSVTYCSATKTKTTSSAHQET